MLRLPFFPAGTPLPCGAWLIADDSLRTDSFVMLAVLGIWRAWLMNRHGAAIVGAVYTIIIVWPFSVLLYVPLGFAALMSRRFGLLKVLQWGCISTVFWAASSTVVDSYFFGKLVLPAWQIVEYNVLGDSGGPELYGVEPFHFYLQNAALNFNLAFVLALMLPAALLCRRFLCTKILHKQAADYGVMYLTPLYVWVAFFSSIAHKEERFLCPVYPLICLAAACCLEAIFDISVHLLSRCCTIGRASMLANSGRTMAIALIAVLSISRGAALHFNYAAPLQVREPGLG